MVGEMHYWFLAMYECNSLACALDSQCAKRGRVFELSFARCPNSLSSMVHERFPDRSRSKAIWDALTRAVAGCRAQSK